MPDRKELYTSALMQKGYLPDWNYVVAVLDICDRLESESGNVFYSPLSKERLELFMKKTDGILTGKQHETIVFTDKDSLICIFSDMQETQAAAYMEDILRQIKPWLKTSEAAFTAVGSTADGFLGLSKSYKMAVKIKNLARYEQREFEICTYSAAGMYQLLFQIEDTDCFLDYYNHTIKALDEYDALNESNLTEVLEMYMENDGSVQQTAAQMFVHRNTINYKLKKIESLLDMDLTSFSVRNELALGLQVSKILKCGK
jgi:DNA-binding PucR family transcriptional regulator